jgi:8-oxo-dGTP pyrophosphatase MutT (NUDIX family)
MSGAKLDFSEEVLEGAKRELKEETGLYDRGKIISIYNIRTYEDKKILAHLT